jgi:hypothetical protein
MRRIVVLIVVVGLLSLVPATALAASSTCQAYNPQTCQVTPTTTEPTADGTADATATTASSGTLPFTGLDAVLLVAGGAALIGAGLAVRRFSRRLG